jgi:hypothetical protein
MLSRPPAYRPRLVYGPRRLGPRGLQGPAPSMLNKSRLPLIIGIIVCIVIIIIVLGLALGLGLGLGLHHVSIKTNFFCLSAVQNP